MSTQRLIVLLTILLSCCCGGGGLLMGVVAPLGELSTMAKVDFGRQCDIALGPATGTTAPATTTAASSATVSPSPRPSSIPYASLTLDPDDPDIAARDRECVSAMRAAACAADLALRYPEAGGTAQMAEYVRDVVYSASAGAVAGRCVPGRAPRAAAAENCGDPVGGEPVVLPETVREQAYCGQIVDPGATSPGDLVFWDYRDNAATRVGIALGPAELVTVDEGKFIRSRIPGNARVQVKRVLGGVS
ncbi:hypothetical protein [Nocardia sp. CA-290969]|uniref:hypothetical protein n=1 Tax=Nocardia sp. CA-290969 TaxID=3239986 RepID=UPI003D94A73D